MMAAERVHPTSQPDIDSPVRSASRRTTSSNDSFDRGIPPLHKPGPTPPPPGTYVIQLPKDQIFNYPPPENENKFRHLSNKKPRRSCCRLFLCYTIAFILIFILALAIAAGVLYLVFRPEAPKYTVSGIAIRGMNLTSSYPISPEFDVNIGADNKNKKLGIYYQSGSEIEVFYNDVILSNGVLPVFYQPSKNVTVFRTVLKGSNVVLGNAVRSKLVNEQKQGKVPFRLNVKAPVKIKVGAVKTWEITVKVKCDINVDAVNEKSRITSRNCDYSVKLW
ncbi:hypothetical protein M9H77_17041 [Catharanthus roseus]|uniref:Uncharacterized protein n=1 Tax=Catharanthus roseus TaxID=4058 RepID=A0ACC0B3H1_CATRO|nr:hypothetical protein M9H77_17041 [Catharanthus roseus]